MSGGSRLSEAANALPSPGPATLQGTHGRGTTQKKKEDQLQDSFLFYRLMYFSPPRCVCIGFKYYISLSKHSGGCFTTPPPFVEFLCIYPTLFLVIFVLCCMCVGPVALEYMLSNKQSGLEH